MSGLHGIIGVAMIVMQGHVSVFDLCADMVLRAMLFGRSPRIVSCPLAVLNVDVTRACGTNRGRGGGTTRLLEGGRSE